MGVIGGVAAVSCDNMAPHEKLAAYLSPPVEMIPGIAAFYATVCRACPAGCGIWVKTRERRPIKLEGNPVHPINRGALCLRGQAFIEDLYGRGRVKKPLVRVGGKLTETSWQNALATAGKHLASSSSTGIVTGLESGVFGDLVTGVSKQLRSAKALMYEPLANHSLTTASSAVFGKSEAPRTNLESADYVLSIGADFLDTWSSPVELSRQWAERHSVEAGRRLTMDYVGPRRNLTATSADHFHKLSADDAGALAIAVLHEVHKERAGMLSGADMAAVNRMIRILGTPPDSGLPKALVSETTKKLLAAKSPVVLFGGADVLCSQATTVGAAVLLTNVLLGAVGKSLRYGEGTAESRAASEAEVLTMLSAEEKGLDVLLTKDVNLIADLPGSTGIQGLLDKTKFKIALAAHESETTEMADLVLPIHHPLESWGDYRATNHIWGLMQPVRAPLYDTKHAGEILLTLGKQVGFDTDAAKYKDYLVKRLTESLYPPTPAPIQVDADGGVLEETEARPLVQRRMTDAEWEQMLVDGGYFGKPENTGAGTAAPPVRGDGTLPAFDAAGSADGYTLLTPTTVSLFDGRGARSDWLMETPDPLTQTAWEIPVELAPDVAASKGVKDGDRVKVKSPSGELEGVALVETGLVKGTVAVRLGATERAGLKGSAVSLLEGKTDALSGALIRTATQVTVSKIAKGEITSVMGSPDSEGRLLALSMGLDDYEKKRFPVITRHGEVKAGDESHGKPKPVPMPHEEKGGERPADNMYSLQEHAEHRWGLVIDLDRCTGCSACVAACYAENNIPIVGKKEVAYGRELSWIRIEKHVFGTGEDERVRFLPVMCQQCDNAPCETVCPVFAASHTADGLNAQIYNRCIGTRYCSNNCPYKVRRFNYFDYKREEPGNQQLNPDVTVRSRGVMEKCTFCIQRIREVQNRRKVEGRDLRDGEIVPACAQTCPTSAITFGDFNQQDWKMSEMARNPRGYRLLDYMVNTRPGVVYLRKVDTEKEGEDS